MTGVELHLLLNRVAEGSTPEDRDAAWNAIADEFAKRSQWIDPQRIVELTKRFQDQEGTALVALWFSNHDPSFGEPQWTVELPSGRTVDGKTAADALKGAEA